MTTLFVPGESDADNKKKSGSMSDDGMLFCSCFVSLYVLVCSVMFSSLPFSVLLVYFYNRINTFV